MATILVSTRLTMLFSRWADNNTNRPSSRTDPTRAHAQSNEGPHPQPFSHQEKGDQYRALSLAWWAGEGYRGVLMTLHAS